jgi:ABC-2 type transport system ATP-binding protein
VDTVLRAEELGKVYKGSEGHSALDRVNVEVHAGEVFSLIGRNGAGKTTFLRIAGTQLLPTTGHIEVLGHDAVAGASVVRERIAVIPQEARPFFYATPFEHVYYYLTLRGFPRSEARRKAVETLERLGLASGKDTVVRKLSGGMRRRVLVAMVLASGAELLFLDEPTTGLDPLARREVWTTIKEAAKEGRTILLTTHYLEEAEILSDRIAILDRGRVLAQGNLDDLMSSVRYPFRVSVLGGGLGRRDLDAYGTVTAVGDRWTVFTSREGAEELTRVALNKGARAVAGPVTLEDLFIQLVGSEIDAEAAPEEAWELSR